MGRYIVVLAAIIVALSRSFAAEVPVVLIPANAPLQLTGNAGVDIFGQQQLADMPHFQQAGEPGMVFTHKSPWLAAGLSLLLPGAGEFYAESYWQAAAFLLADAAAWTFALVNNNKGDKQTDFFQTYADQHWSVVKYGQYIEDKLNLQGRYNWLKPGTTGLPPWRRVDWTELYKLEREVQTRQGGLFGILYSHNLPPYGDQQYFELIGKYQQFNQGWDDATKDPYLESDDVTPRLKYYASERGKANDFYNTASTFVKIAVVVHVLSAIDAAWSASSYNKWHTSMGMQHVPTGDGGYTNVPVVKLSYSF